RTLVLLALLALLALLGLLGLLALLGLLGLLALLGLLGLLALLGLLGLLALLGLLGLRALLGLLGLLALLGLLGLLGLLALLALLGLKKCPTARITRSARLARSRSSSSGHSQAHVRSRQPTGSSGHERLAHMCEYALPRWLGSHPGRRSREKTRSFPQYRISRDADL